MDNASLLTALTNDVGWGNVFSYQLERKVRSGDVLVLFSVHGGSGQEDAGTWSQNLLRAAEIASKAGAIVVAFTGFDGGHLKDISDISVHVDVNNTPIVEGWHSLAAHLAVDRLAE